MMQQQLLDLSLNSKTHDLLRQLSDLSDDIWLVGGTIRDLLEGRAPHDIDVVFATDLTPKVRIWARRHAGKWFWLDRKRNQSRVLFVKNGLQFDFAPLRAENIISDLKLRDFTINAMALPLFSIAMKCAKLLDPLGGRNDLELGVLRSCGPRVLCDDPLRALKGIRHFALGGWQFDEQTRLQILAVAPQILSIAGERIRNEFGQILASDRVIHALDLMLQLGIFDNLFPGIKYGKQDQQLVSLVVRINQMEQNPLFELLLSQSIEEGLNRRAILCLAALLPLVNRLDIAEEVAQRLRCSAYSRSILKSLCTTQASLESFSHSDTPRVAALKLESLGSNCIEQALFSLAKFQKQTLDLLISGHINAYQKHLQQGRLADLLDGQEILALTKLSAGPIVGEWQARIKRAEIAGEITCKATAADWLNAQLCD